jgi:hypothetical protein
MFDWAVACVVSAAISGKIKKIFFINEVQILLL